MALLMYGSKIVALLLASAFLVTGHGGGMHYTIDGVVHPGFDIRVRNNNTGTIQRAWNWNSVDKIDHPDLSCGHDGSPYSISYHAPIRSGSTVSINYTLPTSNWTFGHPYGPMVSYMAVCPSEGCENVDLLAPIWFKVWQVGLMSGNFVDGHWAMKDIMDGANLEIPTPASLKPGKYLLKHDMINLQTGPVQIFPNCIQLDVVGQGTKLPDAKELVAFPGGYDKDTGISWPGIREGSEWFYTKHNKDTFYPMPGPPVWNA